MYKRRIKIIHIQLLPIMSGVQKAMFELLSGLDQDRYEIMVLCKEEGELTEELRKLSVRTITMGTLVRPINPFLDILALFKLYFLFKKIKPDIVHTHSSKTGFLGRISAHLAGVPVVFHTIQGFAVHQYSSRISNMFLIPIERFAAHYADMHISVNEYDRIYAIKKKIIPPKKIVTVYNGIRNFNSYPKESMSRVRESLNIPKDSIIVTQVGRLWKQKAPHVFVRTAAKVLKSYPRTFFIMVGDGASKQELISLSKNLGISEHIRFLGWRKDVDRILGITDIFVLTSLWEGLSIAILEAMAKKIAVVASDIKGNNELVVDGKTGYLCEPNNSNSFSEKIGLLINNREHLKSMGEEAFNRFNKYFTVDHMVKQIDDLYQSYYRLKVKQDKADI